LAVLENKLLYFVVSTATPAICPTVTGILPISPLDVLLAFLTENIADATELYIKT
jgi:hypothetical protein